jgi:hypothetical protein
VAFDETSLEFDQTVCMYVLLKFHLKNYTLSKPNKNSKILDRRKKFASRVWLLKKCILIKQFNFKHGWGDGGQLNRSGGTLKDADFSSNISVYYLVFAC